MNRIQLWNEDQEASIEPATIANQETTSEVSHSLFSTHSAPSAASAHGLVEPARDEELACSFFAPLHYEPRYAYPLIVWLHGPRDDENQLKRIMPLVSMRNYVAVSPQGTRRCAEQGSGYTWRQTEADILLAEQRVFDSMAVARQRFHIRSGRVFLAGFDTGGTMAFRIALEHPGRFAGVLSLNGAFPTGRAPLRRLNEARRLPVFLASGRDSEVYPAHQVCDNLRLFHSAGLDISLRQYPCAHEITTTMLSDLDRWIMEQIASST